MKIQLTRLVKIISGHWLEITLVFVAALAGLSVVAWLAAQLAGGELVAALMVTAVIVMLIIEGSRYRTFRRLELLRLQATTSSALGKEITANPDFDALVQEIVTLLQAEFKYEYVGICLLDANLCITRFYQAGQVQVDLSPGQALDGDMAPGIAAGQRQVVCVQNGSPPAPGQVTLLPQMRSELALPLMVGQRLLGVMDIQSRDAAAFEADHILVLESLAAQTAAVIRNAALYKREADRRSLAETLYEIGLALSGTLDREEVLGNILQQIDSVIPYERAALLLQYGDELEIVAARGFPAGSEPLKIRIPLDQGDEEDIYLTIYRTHEPLVVPDVSRQANWQHVAGLPQARSWLGVPLIHDKQVIGMLSLVREKEEAYSEEDTVPATTFAVQAAVALHNAELYNQIDQFNRQLSYEMEQRTEAVIQLSRLDQAKSDFINVAAHELRTPLTTIQGYSQMLLQEDNVSENPYQNELVTGIYKGAERLHEIVNNMLNVAKIDNQALNLHFQTVSLSQLLERICARLMQSAADRQLTLTLEPMTEVPEIQGDLSALRMMFRHLLLNAVKYTPDGGTITVSHTLIREGDTAVPTHIEVVISDTGIGIPPEAQELIFTKFYQTGKIALHSTGKTKFKGGGPGLGLAIVRGIVEAHNGKVWADSPGYSEQTLPGSHFHVVLPIHQPT